jgi:hypothetical protein
MENVIRNKVVLYATGVFACGGIWFTLVMAKYGLSYFVEHSNPLRHEYLEGVYLSLMFSLPFWVVSSGLAREVKAQIPALIYKAMRAITVLFCSVFALFIVFTLLLAFLDGQ